MTVVTSARYMDDPSTNFPSLGALDDGGLLDEQQP
jgi:hypothetical protein